MLVLKICPRISCRFSDTHDLKLRWLLTHLIFPKDVLNKTDDVSVQSVPWLGHGLHNRGVLVRWKILYSSPNLQPAMGPSQPPIRCRYSSRGVQLLTNPHLVPRLRMDYVYLHSPIRLHDMPRDSTLLYLPPNKIFKSHMARQSTLLKIVSELH
jgi:hypothetical protein